VGIDADGVIAHDAITRLVCHFANPHIGAVAGNAKVGNRVNLWTRWQALEYITSQNFERRALDLFDVVMVVPGAIGAWRTSAVKAGGGYHPDTVAEDADLTMNLLEQGTRHLPSRKLPRQPTASPGSASAGPSASCRRSSNIAAPLPTAAPWASSPCPTS
jgi:hypothetical protein